RSTFLATNCTISGNSSTAAGGGVFNDGIFTASNCTIAANAAGGGGGGISNINTDGATTTLSDTILAENSATSSGPDIFGAGTVNYSLIQNTGGWTSGDTSANNLTEVDPLLTILGNYGGSTQTMALLPGSPCIDAGASTGAPSTDQRGQARVGAVDIGAS